MIHMKRYTALFVLLFALLAQLTAVTAYADITAAVGAPETAEVGESFEVRLTFRSDELIGVAETDIIYNDSVIAFTGGSASGAGGVIHFKEIADTPNNIMSSTLTFTAKAAGDSELTFSNCLVSSADGTPLGSPSGSAVITVKASAVTDDPELSPSDDAPSEPEQTDDGPQVKGVLKSLTVSAGKLIPDFSPHIFDYVVKVDHDVEVFEVDAETASENDYIWFEGSKKLSETGTVRTISVSDRPISDDDPIADGAGYKNVYRIIVQRAPAPETEAESSAAEEVISAEETETVPSVTEAAPVTQPENDTLSVLPVDHSSADSSRETSSGSASGMSELRSKLMPWLLVILAVLIAALVIILKWLKNKSVRKRRKIKTTYSSGSNSKKNK